MTSQKAKESLAEIEWQEGKIVGVVEGPYRYRIVCHCSSAGRQRALFANGEHPYFCSIEIISGNGQWIQKGASIVPILPDGRFIMVVEQRPAQDRYPGRPMVANIGGQKIDLSCFGKNSSLEFPGGGVDAGEGLKAGFLRELIEETGIEEQKALYYSRRHPLYPFGSDIAVQQFYGVVFLSGLSYENHVETDGGLTVFALTKEEVECNIWNGVIHSGQAALLPWGFYKDVELARSNPDFERMLKESGYLRVEEIKIKIVKP